MRSTHSVQVRVSIQDRDLERFPQEDEALGNSFFQLYHEAMHRGLPPPALFTLFSDRVEIMDMRPVFENGQSMHAFVAAATGRGGVEAVALVGVLDQVRDGRLLARAGSVFVEWPDCRWWHAVQVLGRDNVPLSDTPEIHRAVDGLPRPGGLGGWFSRGRYFGLKLELHRSEDPSEPTSFVH